MIYKLNGKQIVIPDKEIEKLINSIAETKEEAVQIWLDDHDFTVNEEQEELDNKAKKIKIKHEAGCGVSKPRKTVKPVSAEKQSLFAELSAFSQKYCQENGGTCLILKNNKLIEIKIDGKSFKIDLIESRKKL